MNLHKFDIYHGTKKLQIVLRATQILDVLIFFQEKVLSYVWSVIHFVWRNVAFTGRSVWA